MKILIRILLVFVILIVIGVCLAIFTNRPAALDNDSQSAALLKPGKFSVQRQDVTLIDESRATDANNDYPGESQRVLETRIWFPKNSQNQTANNHKHPLVIYSHGFSSMKNGGAYLAQQLASHGYIVMSADFPLTNFGAPGGPKVQDVVNQPGDISFMIDTMLQWNQTTDSPFYNRVDADRIGVMGLSLGGMTTTLVTYHPEHFDKRIKAAISIAGPSSLFTETFFSHNDIPFLMIAADKDALVPYASNAAPLPEKAQNAALVTIADGSHTGFADTAHWLRWMHNPDSLGCDVVTSRVGENAEPWNHLIGSEAQGVSQIPRDELCKVEPLPKTMNPIRQKWLSQLAVESFFQMYFAETTPERDKYRQYFRRTMASELADVSVTFSTMR